MCKFKLIKTECFCCPEKPVEATWINSSGERLLVCKEHLKIFKAVHNFEYLGSDCYKYVEM